MPRRLNKSYQILGYGGITSVKGVNIAFTGEDPLLLECDYGRWEEISDNGTIHTRMQSLIDLLAEKGHVKYIEEEPAPIAMLDPMKVALAPEPVASTPEVPQTSEFVSMSIVKKAARKAGPRVTGEAAPIDD